MNPKKTIRFRVIKTSKTHFNNYGVKYNVQVILNGIYSGVGRYCRNMKEVNDYKRKETIYYRKLGYKVIK